MIRMKNAKIILPLLALLFLGLVPLALAQGFVPLAGVPGLTDIQPDQGGLATFFNNLYKYLIGLAAVLAVIEIIWGGLEISTVDSVSKQSDGKARITQAIFGLLLVLSPALVFGIINPSILNLSINLPKLDTASAPNLPPPVSVPCTSNCDTGSTGSGIGTFAGIGIALYTCKDSNCVDAKNLCNNRATTQEKIAGTNYNAVVVCATSGAIDPSGATAKATNGDATACKAGENFVVNCLAQTQNNF